MKQTVSLKKNTDYKDIYREGKWFANKYLVMYIRPNVLEHNRLGISVSKKVGNSVIRHRVTRLIRESYRLSEEKVFSGLDIVVVARANAKDKTYHEIASALKHLMKLHKILLDTKNEQIENIK